MSEKQKTDDLKSLMVLVQEGNSDAFRQLFEIIEPKIMGNIRQRIKNPQTCEDLLQNVVMNIFKARHTYNPDYPFEPWLYSVTRNTVYDYLRKYQKTLSFESFIGDHWNHATETNTASEEAQILDHALKQLPESQAEAVRLLKIDGLSLKEAAEQLKITVTALKVRAHRGYENLKTTLLNEIKKDTWTS